MNNKKPLTPHQKRFAYNYAQSLDPTKSAVNAGYKATTAKERANELLKNPQILDEIHAQIDFAAKTLRINSAFIVKKLLQIISNTSEIEPIVDKSGVPTGANKLRDAAVALRAVDCLSKLFLKESDETPLPISENGVRIMCIENLNDEKI